MDTFWIIVLSGQLFLFLICFILSRAFKYYSRKTLADAETEAATSAARETQGGGGVQVRLSLDDRVKHLHLNQSSSITKYQSGKQVIMFKEIIEFFFLGEVSDLMIPMTPGSSLMPNVMQSKPSEKNTHLFFT